MNVLLCAPIRIHEILACCSLNWSTDMHTVYVSAHEILAFARIDADMKATAAYLSPHRRGNNWLQASFFGPLGRRHAPKATPSPQAKLQPAHHLNRKQTHIYIHRECSYEAKSLMISKVIWDIILIWHDFTAYASASLQRITSSVEHMSQNLFYNSFGFKSGTDPCMFFGNLQSSMTSHGKPYLLCHFVIPIFSLAVASVAKWIAFDRDSRWKTQWMSIVCFVSIKTKYTRPSLIRFVPEFYS